MNELRPLNYKKLGSRFFKIEQGFFRQVDIQSGAHGRYFFVNICLHPVGLPRLLAGKLVIPDRPTEHECIIRRRINDVVSGAPTESFRLGLVSPDNDTAIRAMLPSLSAGVEMWLSRWGSFRSILTAPDCEMHQALTVVPNLREKACKMLKCFCAYKIHEVEQAQEQLRLFLAAPISGYDFSRVDEYMCSVVCP
jgi:hypothetical protein